VAGSTNEQLANFYFLKSVILGMSDYEISLVISQVNRLQIFIFPIFISQAHIRANTLSQANMLANTISQAHMLTNTLSQAYMLENTSSQAVSLQISIFTKSVIHRYVG